MNLTVTSHNDRNAVAALIRFGMCRKADPQKRMRLSIVSCFVFMIAAMIGLCLYPNEFEYFILILLCAVLFLLLQCYMYWGLPKIIYRGMHKFGGAKNIFTFTEDQLHVRSQSDAYTAEESVGYTMLYQAAETKAYFFLYQTKQVAYVIEKSSLTEEQIVQIREKLSGVLQKKYIVCKY